MTMSSPELKRALELFEFAPGKKASWSTLKRLLPDVKTALFFAKAYRLNYQQLSALIYGLFKTPLFAALGSGEHSVDLQDYLVDTIPPDVWPEDVAPDFQQDVPHGEFLPELLDAAMITIAKSISEVADKLGAVLDSLPSKEGSMVFQTMAKMNRQRPTIGVHQAGIQHQRVQSNLVILDVSGSMTEDTISAIVNDVVALSWKANAHLAIVSNNTYVWEPGTYNVEDVLHRAEYGGTRYETLAPLFDRDWGTVITIADYDSSPYAKQPIAQRTGRVGKVLDVSLVNRPTYLAEVVGQLADEVEPLLVASTSYVLPY
jgi:hypothetical protein